MSEGVLFVVATPIGNLEDLSERARRTLAEADLVAAEDTRRARELLSHLGLKKTILSHYEPREEKSLGKIIAALQSGKAVALVTDGGTPAISDPGYRLVRAAHQAGIRVTPIPGPSALTAALSAGGLPTDLVTFAGFLPAKKGARKKALAELKDRRDTLVLFESPRRAAATISDALEILGDREAVLLRELTKMFEERMAGTLSQLASRLADRELKGELTILIRGAPAAKAVSEDELKILVGRALNQEKLSVRELSEKLAGETGAPRKKIYALALEEMKKKADR